MYTLKVPFVGHSRSSQAWKKCRSRDLGSDKTADFGIKFGENTILVGVSRIEFTFWGVNRMG